jgi:hypothetical protein
MNFLPAEHFILLRLLVLLLLPGLLIAQQRDTPFEETPPEIRDIVEDFLQNQGDERDFDFNALFEELESYRENPLNINRATEGELRELRLLSDRQILELMRYRQQAGALISLYELQAIPSFDLNTIQRILPYVGIEGALDDYRVGIPEMIAGGKNEFFLRWSRIAELQKGYTPLEAGQEADRYLGNPNQLYFRYRHSYSTRFRFGLTAEKDRGEEFFAGSNRQGFDYYSAHFYLRDYNRTLKALALGDYNISFGQGLLLFSGFSYGKGSETASVKRSGRTVSPYASVNEALFMRGAAATFAFGDHWELTSFLSFRSRDGNLSEPDTTAAGLAFQEFSSFDLDGYHRTPGEIADERVIRQFTTGGSLKYRMPQGHLAVNALFDRFDKPLQRRPRPYNRFYFNGQQLLNLSVDYSYIFQNFNFFGETAMSDNGAIATINGLLIGLGRKADLAVLFRHFPRDYTALNANPFAESSGGRNETGAYLGLEVRPAPHWTLNAYFDAWQHPWLRFNADAPSRGREFRSRLTFYLKRQLHIYLEARNKVKELNASGNDSPLDYLLPHRLFQTRLHIAPQISKALELRTRVDWGFSHNDAEGKHYGVMFLQDVLFRPIEFPFSFTTRFAIFDTDGYGIRFYHYENDLLYTFSIPAYYNRGTRFYLNLRYRPARAFTFEVRFAQTYWANQKTIGSGLEEIDGPVRTELRAQVKYQFSWQ